mmetsp:Transcript_35833/g.143204  ORF Transcript_35833/g.143204 Transcript_35833/m.143204 type:complete len:118 (-) Transcript_35833:1924-2277(-)
MMPAKLCAAADSSMHNLRHPPVSPEHLASQHLPRRWFGVVGRISQQNSTDLKGHCYRQEILASNPNYIHRKSHYDLVYLHDERATQDILCIHNEWVAIKQISFAALQIENEAALLLI